MLTVKTFVFNAYEENTYLLYDSQGKAILIDPGCYTVTEQKQLAAFVAENNLSIQILLNTHGHIDHMLGNAWAMETWKPAFAAHALALEEFQAAQAYGPSMGIYPAPSPLPDRQLKHGDTVSTGEILLEVLYTPGHARGHLSFYHRESGRLFSGDVLFYNSIGRTDFPGGSYPQLIETIRKVIFPLGDEVEVYPGHGPNTVIGEERKSNPFLVK